MSQSLRNTLTQLASSFAQDVLKTIRDASLDELVTETGRSGGASSAPAAPRAPGKRRRGGRVRRSAEDIAHVSSRIVALLKTSPKGLRSEELRARLGLRKEDMPRPITESLASGVISKKGERRATRYFAGGGGRSAGAKGGKRRAKK